MRRAPAPAHPDRLRLSAPPSAAGILRGRERRAAADDPRARAPASAPAARAELLELSRAEGPRSRIGRASFPAASSSGSRSRARSPTRRACCSPTSRPETSIRYLRAGLRRAEPAGARFRACRHRGDAQPRYCRPYGSACHAQGWPGGRNRLRRRRVRQTSATAASIRSRNACRPRAATAFASAIPGSMRHITGVVWFRLRTSILMARRRVAITDGAMRIVASLRRFGPEERMPRRSTMRPMGDTFSCASLPLSLSALSADAQGLFI